MTHLKMNYYTLVDFWNNDMCSWLGDDEMEVIKETVNRLWWPGQRAPRVDKVTVFAWDDVDWVEIQVSYHRGCWKRAVYRVSPGEAVLICKDWKGQQFGAACPF